VRHTAVLAWLTTDAWEPLVAALGLGAARTVPLAWLMPALGGPRLAPELRVALGLLLSVLCLPFLLPAASVTLAGLGPVGCLLLVARELLVGLTVGLCAAAVFRAAEAAGRLVDVVRGANLAEVLAPLTEERASPMGELYLFLAIVVFLELGGLRGFATALGRSYEAVPLGLTTSPAVALRAAAALVTASVGKLLETAVGLAAPVVVAMWLADAALGVVGRAAPQLSLTFAVMPAKALLGLGVVLLGIGALDGALVAGFPAWIALVEGAFGLWRAR
jgi:type III secretory pathway component EscT